MLAARILLFIFFIFTSFNLYSECVAGFKDIESSSILAEENSEEVDAEPEVEEECPSYISEEVRDEFRRDFENGEFAIAAEKVSEYVDKCTDGMHESIYPHTLHYWIVSDLMKAQFKLQRYESCIESALKVIHMWGWGDALEESRESEAMLSVKENLAMCRSAFLGISETDFLDDTCPLAGHGSAVKIPESWSGIEAQCVYVEDGNRLYNYDYDLISSDDKSSLAPDLVFVYEERDGRVVEKRVEFTSGTLSRGHFCSGGALSLGGSGDNRLLLLNAGVGYCWPGSAAFAVDEVYKLDSDYKVEGLGHVMVTIR